MKKLLLTLFILASTATGLVAQNWSVASQQQQERNYLYLGIAKIKNYYGVNNSAWQAEVLNFLRGHGTPLSLQVLKELVKNKELPAHFLNNV